MRATSLPASFWIESEPPAKATPPTTHRTSVLDANDEKTRENLLDKPEMVLKIVYVLRKLVLEPKYLGSKLHQQEHAETLLGWKSHAKALGQGFCP